MPINFPSNPSTNDVYTYGGRSWKFNGTGWETTNPSAANAGGDLTGTYPNPTIANGAVTAAKLASGIFALSTSAQTASYTLVIGDQDKLVEVSNASANTLTVPTNANVAFPTGAQVHVLQTGAGQTTLAGAAGVTVNATPGLKLRAQWSSATLIKRATNTWVAVGDLVA